MPEVSLRKQKRRHHLFVDARLQMGLLTEEQASQFKLMFSRCKREKDFEQVLEALRGYCSKIQKDQDRYSRLMKDDPLGLED